MQDWMAAIDYFKESGLEDKRQYHIQCSAGDVAPIVIVPGHQGRVEKIVNHLDGAHKISENRGLITYTGTYSGVPVSVTSTGMGGPSAAIVYEELINIGARYLVRVGSVAALQPDISKGDISLPFACIRDDGASRYYVPENYPAAADPELYSSLVAEAKASGHTYWTGINWTHSAFYTRSNEYFRQWWRKRVITLEMEAAALMVIATLRGASAAFIGTVYENRILQATDDGVDLSVKNVTEKDIQLGEEHAIRIALKGAVRAFQSQ
ncbi:MAG: nucleoside phosphorylase [Spirochaetota bacterium]|nr:nucleoside phosphorylase [Spirochaetota bacterium]